MPTAFAFDCSSLEDVEECEALKEIDEDLIVGLIYASSSFPDYNFVYNYNSDIEISTAPDNTTFYSKGVIRDAWLGIFTIMPSVLYQDRLYVPSNIELRSDFNYDIVLPADYYSDDKRDGRTCKIFYSLDSNSETLNFYVDGNKISSNKKFYLALNNNATISGVLEISAVTKKEEYIWDRYCCSMGENGCSQYCYSCDYTKTDHIIDNLAFEESVDLVFYDHNPNTSFEFINEYYGTSKGIIKKDNDTNIILRFNNSYLKESEFEYNAVFIKKPYYFLQLKADRKKTTDFKNLIKSNNSIYVKDASNCSLQYSDFFETRTEKCSYEYKGEDIKEFEVAKASESWKFLFKLVIFILACYLIYELIKKYWNKVFLILGTGLLLIPSVFAEECGLTNLASCIPEKIYEFIIGVINAPLQPLLSLMRSLLENPPSVDLFYGIWAIITYCISLFYGLLFIYSGFQFLFSGHDVVRRAIAKEWLKNTVIMIILVQASFYLYSLVVDIGSIMTSAVLSLVDEHFFMLTADNINNIGLEFLFFFFYALTLFITILLLVIRYLVISFGVLLAPLGIFCYFIPPLKSYGKLTLHMLGMFIFVTFVDAIIILACSMLIQIPLFGNFKILVMIACFQIIDILFLVLIIKIIIKSVSSDSGEKLAQAVKYIAMLG